MQWRMDTEKDPIQIVETLCDLLQRVHFDARDQQQYAPESGKETIPDQLHRIRMLTMQLRTLLASHAATA